MPRGDPQPFPDAVGKPGCALEPAAPEAKALRLTKPSAVGLPMRPAPHITPGPPRRARRAWYSQPDGFSLRRPHQGEPVGLERLTKPRRTTGLRHVGCPHPWPPPAGGGEYGDEAFCADATRPRKAPCTVSPRSRGAGRIGFAAPGPEADCFHRFSPFRRGGKGPGGWALHLAPSAPQVLSGTLTHRSPSRGSGRGSPIRWPVGLPAAADPAGPGPSQAAITHGRAARLCLDPRRRPPRRAR